MSDKRVHLRLYKKIFRNNSNEVDMDGLIKMSNDTCPICLSELDEEESNVYKIECGHIFHTECIMKWFGYIKRSMSMLFR